MTASIDFREATAADRDSILALRALAFPDDDREKQQPDFWDWQFAAGYAGPGRVFMATSGNRVVGHFAFVPQRYAGHEMVRGALACDVMTHPDYRRQKVFSRLSQFAADRLREDFQIITAFQIREEVMGGMLAGGWEPAQQLPVLLKPLSFTRILRDFAQSSGEQAPRRSNVEDRHASGPIRALTAADFHQIDSLVTTNHPRQKRTLDFLEWRYRRNPHWRYAIEGLFEGTVLRAFVVHRQASLKGRETLAIADAGVQGGREELLQQLVKHVCATHGRGLGLAAALMSDVHPAYRVLRKSGFLPGPHRFRLLLQVFDERLHDVHTLPWSLSWGDTDHL